MPVIDCDYLPTPSVKEFPQELAVLIVCKAASMATAFEEAALDQLTRDAISAISTGADPGSADYTTHLDANELNSISGNWDQG